MKGRGKAASTPPKGSSPEEVETPREGGVSEYEQKRLARITANRARLHALGLPKLASSLLGSPNRGPVRGKRKNRGIDDDEYQPSDEDGGVGSSSSEEEEEEKQGKSKIAANIGNTSCVMGYTRGFDTIDDDVALQQAISLSLGVSKENPGAVLGGLSQNSSSIADDSGSRVKKNKTNIKETPGKRNSRKRNKSRVQLNEDEVVAYFFQFDEAGKGHITLRDLQRMVAAHDFTWTDMEMAHMIHSFDNDRDGKLNLADFRTIVTRCNMLQEHKE